MKFLTRFAESLTSDERSNPATVEKKFRETCKTVKKREERFVSINKLTDCSRMCLLAMLTIAGIIYVTSYIMDI